MQDIKISLITVCYNAESTILGCIKSVFEQDYKNIEYIIIDGGSTDRTVEYVLGYSGQLTHFVSEPDNGIYDAINKGIKMASGDIVGLLNADDYFPETNVLSTIAGAFKQSDADVVYGDLDYVNAHGRILRKWRSGNFKRNKFRLGWMPPHPTFYCKRDLFKQYGYYSLDFGTAGDYELMLRFLYVNDLKVSYINRVLVKMRVGGQSNQNLVNRKKALANDLKAMRVHGISIPFLSLFLKPARKLTQYF
ncbi:MAG: glycosyltransferase family 2 protein [Mucilaginibacter sp.]